MKEGLFFENDELIYYKNGVPFHAGVIQVDGDIYYISSKGRAVRGRQTVHRDRANGLLERGFYTFGEDYKLVEGSFKPVRKQKGYKLRSLRHKLKKNKFVKKYCTKKSILPVLAVAASVFLLTVLVDIAQQERADNFADVPAVEDTTDNIPSVSFPDFEEEVLLCSERVKQLFTHQIPVAEALEGGEPYKPFVFRYGLHGQTGTLQLSEDAAFADFREYALAADSEHIQIDNLKTGTDYYYRVLVGEEVYEGSFKTAASTRFVSIPGLQNTRDIGGYTTLDGRTVRQGLLIRGVEIDGLMQPAYFIPEEHIGAVQEDFGFVYDFDLRGAYVFPGSNYQSRLGEDVGHRFYDAPAYGEIFRTDGAARVKEIFRDLAVAEHYPMYLHCTYGTDRTGTIVFLLQGLLGMSEADLVQEYQLTAFFNPDLAEAHNMEILINGLQNFAGDTLQEKIENYMVDFVGLTPEEIETIRSMFLE